MHKTQFYDREIHILTKFIAYFCEGLVPSGINKVSLFAFILYLAY